jgi:transposase
MSTHPDWALAHKKTGTELRLLNGKYYLYQVTSKWNKEKKRSQKITGKLLGTITREDGFIESEKRRIEHQSTIISYVTVKEYGITLFLQTYMQKYESLLSKHFPEYWQQIICLAYGRLVEQSPLKNMEHFYEHSYLSVLYPGLNISGKRLSVSLRELGYRRDRMVSFFKEFSLSANDCIIFDGTDMPSQSAKIELCEMSKSKRGTYESLFNTMFIFSVQMQLPIYYRLLNAKIKDVKSFKLCLLESGIEQAVIIVDKGFYSKANIEELESENLKFIIPLHRNNSLIDYGLIKQNNKQLFNGFFEHEKRFVWFYQLPLDNGQTLFVYMDEELKNREEKDYLNRVKNKIEDYSLEKYYLKQYSFGTIALLTNTANTGEKVYADYKTRTQIEEMIDSMKNVVEADKTYMQNEQTLEAWMFVNYIALHWYYIILQKIKLKKLNSKLSPQDLLLKLKELRRVKINEKWYNAEITAKTQQLLNKLDVKIPIT